MAALARAPSDRGAHSKIVRPWLWASSTFTDQGSDRLKHLEGTPMDFLHLEAGNLALAAVREGQLDYGESHSCGL